MADSTWLTIIGLGEDGPDGLSASSRAALAAAEIVMGPPRHLGLLPDLAAERVVWPAPFADGLAILKGFRGRVVAVLASGDPLWFGAGGAIAREFAPEEWRALPGPSCFSLAANHLGWRLERTACLGLHAAPLTRLRPHLAPGARLIATLRDGAAVAELGGYLSGLGFGSSALWIMEALGGPRERICALRADAVAGDFAHPVCAALEVRGEGLALPRASGLPDALFQSDGVMTKRPMRALTLSALAPRAGELLWDIGGGSGSVAVEWLLSDPACAAICVEPRADRIALIRANARALGVDRLRSAQGAAPEALDGLPAPDAVFIGGGLSADLLEALRARAPGARLVVNAVTLEAEALLIAQQARFGGELLRIALARAAALGGRRGWKAAYPAMQWSAVL